MLSVDKLCWLHSSSGSRKHAEPSNEKDRVMTDADKTRYHRHEPRDRALRVSDAEREAVAAILRREHVDGRLDNVEFDERLSRCLTARTYAELDGLLADLPIENHTPRLSTRFSPWPFPLLPMSLRQHRTSREFGAGTPSIWRRLPRGPVRYAISDAWERTPARQPRAAAIPFHWSATT